jgi:putative two-component system response regulator
VALGQKMGLSEKEIGALRLGSILHDIGNIEVSADILRKPSSLSDNEWKVIKSHPDAGYRMCLPLARNLGLALQIIRHHHERPDGSGYPDGLSAEEISVPCQIMTVVDIYDALTNDRPFRKAMGKQEAIEILRLEVKEGKLDKEIVQQLIDIVGEGRTDGK